LLDDGGDDEVLPLPFVAEVGVGGVGGLRLNDVLLLFVFDFPLPCFFFGEDVLGLFLVSRFLGVLLGWIPFSENEHIVRSSPLWSSSSSSSSSNDEN